MREETDLNKKKILLLLWHPQASALNSGGFIRIKEFFKVTPSDYVIDVLHNYPSIFEKEEVTGDIYQYRIFGLITFIRSKIFILGRFLESMGIFLGMLRKGLNLSKLRGYDVIYVPTGEPITALVAVILRKLFKAKVVMDSLNIEMPTETWKDYYRQLRRCGYSMVHSIAIPLYVRLSIPILIKLFNSTDYVVTVSPYLIKKLRSLGVKTSLDFTPSGVDYVFFTLSPQQKKVYDGIFIGRHELTKGIFDLVSAWKEVVSKHTSATLLMVGSCDSATRSILMQKIKENNLVHNVILAGEISEEEKIKKLKQSKIYIHLALMEPLFPVISILEGLVCGLPLVGYDIQAYREIEDIHHNKAISLVPTGDYKAAALEILRYLQLEESEAVEIGRVAKEYAKEFDWKQIAAKQFGIIRDVIQSGREECVTAC